MNAMTSVSLLFDERVAQADGLRASLWRRLVREPLVLFALIGAAIFALAHVVEQRKQEAERAIGLDAGLSARLANLYRTQFGVSPAPAQLQVIVDDYIDDEVVYREALRLGLDQDDEIIRRRLIQKLEFLQRDSIASIGTGQADLRTYYEAHPQLFSVGARVSFTHAYFNPDRGGDAQALSRAHEARVQLRAGRAVDDDAFPLEQEYSALTRDEAVRLFGASGFVDALFAAPTNEWSEPVRSGFGWHLVKVTAADPARVLPLEAVLPDVRAAYLHDATARARRAQLDALRARYHVVSRAPTP
jgi:hypothetical protein